MQELDPMHAGKSLSQLLLSRSASDPRTRGLGFVSDRQDHSAKDVSKPAFDTSLAS
jgi:hypothetical protein